MRSGVIAQKVGHDPRLHGRGEHIPVTVLKLEKVQVLAQRTDEKNGYTSLQLGAGSRKPSRVTRAEREASPWPRSSPSASSPSSGSAPTT
jgi:large subunit ribosomal protein L3